MRANGMRLAALALLAWLAALIGSISALTAAGHGALGPPPVAHGWAAVASWARGREAPTILMAALRLVSLALAWYLLAISVAGIAARLARTATLIRTVDALTIPGVRRLISGTVGLLALAAPMTPAVAAESRGPVPTPMSTFAVAPTPTPTPTSTSASAAAPAPTPTAASTSTSAPDLRAGPSDRPSHALFMTRLPRTPPAGVAATWTVTPGDSLWHIAAIALTQARGRPPTLSELDPYWRRVVEVNRPHLADADNADLLFPGQVMIVPAPP